MNQVSLFATWIYFLMGFLFVILYNKSLTLRNCKKCGFLVFFIVYIFAIFRYNIGDDYSRYWAMVSSEYGMRMDIEPLSSIIIDFVYRISFPPLLFIIFSTISLVCYYIVISKYSHNQVISWYFYFTFPLLFFQDCSTIRQSAAMGVFFITFLFVDKEKYIWALLCVIIAGGFQKTGIIAILLLLLPLYKRIDRKWNIILFIGSFFGGHILFGVLESFFGNWILVEKLMDYVSRDFSGFNTFQYILFGINIFNLLVYKQLEVINRRNVLYITLVNVGLCLFNLFQFESQTAIRFAAFFLLFELFIIPDYRFVLKRYVGGVKNATVLLFSVMFLLQLIDVILFINAYNSNQLETPVYTPYATWLNHIK